MANEDSTKTESIPIDITYKDIFPYPSYRPSQEEIIASLSDAIDSQKNVLLIASNGTGKTIMALSALLPIALKKNKKIIFCSRTYTQNGRVIQESREILKKIQEKQLEIPVTGIALRGRNEMCPHRTIQRLNLPPNDSMNVCNNLRKNKQCPYFERIMRDKKKLEEIIANLADKPLDAQELMDICEKWDYCPYFMSKFIVKYDTIIVCNYQWVFHPDIRQRFLESMGIGLEDCIIVMDEAHNLPDMANEINSYRITPYNLRMASRDLIANQAPKNLPHFMQSLQEMLELVKDSVDEEVPVDTQKFLKQLLSKCNLDSVNALQSVVSDLHDFSEAVQEAQASAGNITRDYIGGIAEFFTKFLEAINDPAFFQCMTSGESKQGKTVTLELKCLDPRPITDPIFKDTYATLCLSGTLHPFTFTTLLGLNDKGKSLKILKMKHPFPKENIRVVALEQINTRGENRSDALYQTIIPLLREVVKNTPKNVGIFCASYDVLEGLLKNGFDRMVKSLGKTCFSEKSSMSAGDNDILIEQYKSKSTEAGGVLLGVCGGRNSEGEDFPGDFMNAVVVVGVPFQRPTPSLNAKIEYYNKLFSNQGRLFAYTAPAIQKSNQACGRPIRRMDDTAFILLMDNRFLSYKEYLSDWIKEDLFVLPPDPDLLREEIQKFYPST